MNKNTRLKIDNANDTRINTPGGLLLFFILLRIIIESINAIKDNKIEIIRKVIDNPIK
jgi:hypothetical protein